MVKEDVRLRLHVVRQHLERGTRTADLCRVFGISESTLRRWCRNYREEGVEGLRDESRRPRRSPNRTHGNLVNRILQLRRRHPAWGAMRIHALLRRRGVQLSWRTVHRILKRHGFMLRVVRKAVTFKRFQRRHVDSLWQADVYKFRIAGVRGHVYVHTILDDRSRYLVMARAYRRERAREATNNLWWGFKGGRQPKALYVDNGSCYVSKEFRAYCAARGISVIYGRPYNPRGRGKLERFHGILTQELVGRVHFRSLSHFRRELYGWRGRYNRTRIHGGIGWKTPAEVYNDRTLMSKSGLAALRNRSHVLTA
ncbi:MAG: IS481 family transposase [Thermoplasmata archaeon]